MTFKSDSLSRDAPDSNPASASGAQSSQKESSRSGTRAGKQRSGKSKKKSSSHLKQNMDSREAPSVEYVDDGTAGSNSGRDQDNKFIGISRERSKTLVISDNEKLDEIQVITQKSSPKKSVQVRFT